MFLINKLVKDHTKVYHVQTIKSQSEFNFYTELDDDDESMLF